MAYTTSFNNSSNVATAHNRRSPEIAKNQANINPEGKHINWIDENPRKAYERIFGEALKLRDMQHEGREWNDYYKHVCQSKSQNPVYEIVMSVGNIHDEKPIQEPISELILKEATEEFIKRNPNLITIGAYYHADEQGVPHVHIDYIPIAHDDRDGKMSVRCSVRGAMDEMGLSQKEWTRRERKALDDICKLYGLEIYHPDEGKGTKHIEIEAYKILQEAKTQAEQLKQDAIKTQIPEITRLKNELDVKNDYIDYLLHELKDAQAERDEILDILKEYGLDGEDMER